MMLALVLGVALAKKPVEPPPPPADTRDLAVRWVQDSEEYYRLAEQTFQMAQGVVLGQAAFLPAGTPWAVVMDLDETVLDNSQFAVEIPVYTDEAWNAWELRREAKLVPGALAFTDAIHRAGGKIAFVTNRHDATSTMDVIVKLGLYREGDDLCVTTFDTAANKYVSEKRTRRTEVRTGEGECSLGGPVAVLGYFGDQRGDFPVDDELPALPSGASPWGQLYFVIANPMYGSWERAPNRTVPR